MEPSSSYMFIHDMPQNQLCENMKSSTKQEVHIMHRKAAIGSITEPRSKAIPIKIGVKFEHNMISQISEQIDAHTLTERERERDTDRC